MPTANYFLAATKTIIYKTACVLLTDNLDQDPFPPSAVKLSVKDLLPGTKIKLTFGDRYHHFPPHQLPFEMGIAIIFSGAVMSILGDRLMRRQLFQPLPVVLPQSAFMVVNEDAGRNVHRIDQTEPFLNPTFVQGCFYLSGDVDQLNPLLCVEKSSFR